MPETDDHERREVDLPTSVVARLDLPAQRPVHRGYNIFQWWRQMAFRRSDASNCTQVSFDHDASAPGGWFAKIIARTRRLPLLMYGTLFISGGLAMYLLGVATVVPRYLFGLNALLLPATEWVVWYSGVPIVAGFSLVLTDLFLLFPGKRRRAALRFEPVENRAIT